MPDHIHLFISTTTFESPTNLVELLKGVTALRLFKMFPELRNKYWKGKLWSPSYYVRTAGHVSAETIQRVYRGSKNDLTQFSLPIKWKVFLRLLDKYINSLEAVDKRKLGKFFQLFNKIFHSLAQYCHLPVIGFRHHIQP